ncbi:MAG: hypothetical protein M0002_10490 [Rhodospirillales bacterium]|nr:hypothetical protein [Rhodospirillales bacterium]
MDVYRESDRDPLRIPARRNGTLVGPIDTLSIPDTVSTDEARAVAREIMARVQAETDEADRLRAAEVTEAVRLAVEHGVAKVGG